LSTIPLVDLSLQHRQIADEVEGGLLRVMREGTFILGKDVVEFEERFARFVGAAHCIGVGSGTDALELALRAAGVGPGHEVIVPANTFIATALAVSRAGATPALVDCDPEYHLIDVDQVAARITNRTRAIIAVHLYGQMAPMDALAEVAGRAGIPVLEDAAQAHGARQRGRSAGAIGLAAGTSFYPGKNLGAYGDAGAVTTNDEVLARRIRAFGNYGSDRKYSHPELGFNSRLDSLQAVVLNTKLSLLPVWNSSRCEASRRYDALLEGLDWVRRPSTLPGNEHAWHLYVIRIPRRDAVLRKLNEAGIGAGVHYPAPIHQTGAYEFLGHLSGSFPVAEQAAAEILSLPLFPGIREEQQERVVEELALSGERLA